MPYELFLALRHLRSRRRRRLARVTILIAVAGIALGVGALIVALSLANGFRDEMREKILRGTAHINVARADGEAMRDYVELAARLKQIEGVVDASATSYDGAVISGPKGSTYAILRGVDFSSAKTTADLASSIIEGSSARLFEERSSGDLPNVLLGVELAARTGLQVGDSAQLIAAGSGSNSSSSKRSVRVAGTFRSGLFEYDSTWIYLPLGTAASFSGGDHAASVISVQVKDIYNVKPVAVNIRSALGSSYTTVDWQEANRPLFTALTLERRIGLIIIGLIVLIAALNITTTLILVVTERRHDIAILSAMGSSQRSIMGIFVIEGAITGIVGALLGVLLGALTVVIANHYKLISLPAEVYSIDRVRLSLGARDVLLAAAVAVILSIVATLYPAGTAAKIRSAELLRDSG